MLQVDAEYLGFLLIKCGDSQSYSNDHKRSIFTSVHYEIPNFCVPRMVLQLWNWLQIISNGQIMLCRKKCVIFQSNAPCTCTLCTFWGVGITPKTPSGGHASLSTTQQSQRITLSITLFYLEAVTGRSYLCSYFSLFYIEFRHEPTRGCGCSRGVWNPPLSGCVYSRPSLLRFWSYQVSATF